jgi:small subunit ribosomal protein S2
MDKLPGCLFVVDTKREENAVKEANRLNIPVVAICDTNADPDLIAYPIPGNDDAIRALKLIVSIVGERMIAGRERFMLEQQQTIASSAPEASPSQDPAGDVASAAGTPEG